MHNTTVRIRQRQQGSRDGGGRDETEVSILRTLDWPMETREVFLYFTILSFWFNSYSFMFIEFRFM